MIRTMFLLIINHRVTGLKTSTPSIVLLVQQVIWLRYLVLCTAVACTWYVFPDIFF